MKGITVFFVCLGNVCRSPAAEAIFKTLVHRQGLDRQFSIDSAATGTYSLGKHPYYTIVQACQKKGYPIDTERRAKLLSSEMIERGDYFFAADRSVLYAVESLIPPKKNKTVLLLTAFSLRYSMQDVEDPYQKSQRCADAVVEVIEESCQAILDHFLKSFSR